MKTDTVVKLLKAETWIVAFAGLFFMFIFAIFPWEDCNLLVRFVTMFVPFLIASFLCVVLLALVKIIQGRKED